MSVQIQPEYDVAIAGAGPIGCAAALAIAKRGRRVLLTEAQPQVANRFAGEWLHPSGVDALKQLLGQSALRDAPVLTMRGFAVYSDGRRQLLPYASGQMAWAFHHHHLVEWLRNKVIASGNIQLLPYARLCADQSGYAQIEHAGITTNIHARLLLAADGKSSAHARRLNSGPGQTLGTMAGFLLKNCCLPYEGFAHVFLGGLGPILAYRLDATTVRLTLDFPMPASQAQRQWQAYLPNLAAILPATLYNALQIALARQRPTWAAVGYRPRQTFGSGRLRLLGDAAGYVHPLTAAGLTLGLQDVLQLCQYNGNLTKFAAARRQASLAPEFLANALYLVFCGHASGAIPIRRAVLKSWAQSPRLRRQTMDLLSCADVSRYSFAQAFTQIGLAAIANEWLAAWPDLRQGWRQAAQVANWANWPLGVLLPQTLARTLQNLKQARPFLATTPPRQSTQQTAIASRQRATAYQVEENTMTMPINTDNFVFCRNALAAVSRTFAQPIAMLEGHLQTAVMCGYLLCRVADTIEDEAELAAGLREHLFELFLRTLDEENDPTVFALAFPKLRDDDPEIILARQLPKVFSVLATTPTAMQKTVCRWVGEMTRGMAIYKNRGGDRPDGLTMLLTPGDLDRYCYFVAGTVGHMLTELFLQQTVDLEPIRRQRLYENAEAFGMGLQLVNIIKDIAEDRARGVSYVPKTLLEQRNLTPTTLFYKRDHQVLAPLITRAREYLKQALDYTLAIPPTALPLRRFCLFPLLLAADTLALAQNNDALFSNNPADKVKVPRAAVTAALELCREQAGNDATITAAVLARLSANPATPSAYQQQIAV